MIRQILKMLWNKKRSYAGILIEQILIAVILMFCMVSVTKEVRKYKTPGLLDVDNIMCFGYIPRPGFNVGDDVVQNMQVICGNMKKYPYVESISNSYALTPYLRPDKSYSRMSSDSIVIDGNKIQTVIKYSDEYGATVFKPEMEEGQWLDNYQMEDGSAPVVITRQFADKVGWEHAVGKKFTAQSQNCTVVGVATGLKQQSFDLSPVAIVLPLYAMHNAYYGEYNARIKKGEQGSFSDDYYKEFRKLITDEHIEPMIIDVLQMKSTMALNNIFGIVMMGVPTIFLFIFAFIGTFSTYWLFSTKRIREFAVRIAVGSTNTKLMGVVIAESLLITCVALLPALLLSFFIYEYTATHWIAVGITVLTMLLFSTISAWYPAWKVSRVNPAEALQYE